VKDEIKKLNLKKQQKYYIHQMFLFLVLKDFNTIIIKGKLKRIRKKINDYF